MTAHSKREAGSATPTELFSLSRQHRQKAGYIFGSWFDNNELTGSPITAISTNDTGNKTFWAKWIDPAQGAKAELAKLTASLTAQITIPLDDNDAETAAGAVVSSGYTATFTATSYNNGS